jgi:hypothetical protein
MRITHAGHDFPERGNHRVKADFFPEIAFANIPCLAIINPGTQLSMSTDQSTSAQDHYNEIKRIIAAKREKLREKWQKVRAKTSI